MRGSPQTLRRDSAAKGTDAVQVCTFADFRQLQSFAARPRRLRWQVSDLLALSARPSTRAVEGSLFDWATLCSRDPRHTSRQYVLLARLVLSHSCPRPHAPQPHSQSVCKVPLCVPYSNIQDLIAMASLAVSERCAAQWRVFRFCLGGTLTTNCQLIS